MDHVSGHVYRGHLLAYKFCTPESYHLCQHEFKSTCCRPLFYFLLAKYSEKHKTSGEGGKEKLWCF